MSLYSSKTHQPSSIFFFPHAVKKDLISERLEDEENFRNKLSASAANRETRSGQGRQAKEPVAVRPGECLYGLLMIPNSFVNVQIVGNYFVQIHIDQSDESKIKFHINALGKKEYNKTLQQLCTLHLFGINKTQALGSHLILCMHCTETSKVITF